jgi:hypothetical protein
MKKGSASHSLFSEKFIITNRYKILFTDFLQILNNITQKLMIKL